VDYQLAAWCYGALNEYLDVYERVKPELVDIDRMFGTPVTEAEPYHSDIAAARVELKVIGDAVTQAQKASPHPITAESAAALHQGAAIWSMAEAKPRRELARAWLMWALPARCDSVSREVAAKSSLLGRALKYNNGADAAPVAGDGSAPAEATPPGPPAPDAPPAPDSPPAPPDATAAPEPPAPAAPDAPPPPTNPSGEQSPLGQPSAPQP
jgi:hypothetical protein